MRPDIPMHVCGQPLLGKRCPTPKAGERSQRRNSEEIHSLRKVPGEASPSAAASSISCFCFNFFAFFSWAKGRLQTEHGIRLLLNSPLFVNQYWNVVNPRIHSKLECLPRTWLWFIINWIYQLTPCTLPFLRITCVWYAVTTGTVPHSEDAEDPKSLLHDLQRCLPSFLSFTFFSFGDGLPRQLRDCTCEARGRLHMGGTVVEPSEFVGNMNISYSIDYTVGKATIHHPQFYHK